MFRLKGNIIRVLERDNERLKKENERLQDELYAIRGYKNDYVSLIEDLKESKKQYEKMMIRFNKIEKGYKMELDKILK